MMHGFGLVTKLVFHFLHAVPVTDGRWLDAFMQLFFSLFYQTLCLSSTLSPGAFLLARAHVFSLSLSFRCTRKEKCERSSEPRRFASDIKQCVRLSVHPNNISVSQYSVMVRYNRIKPST